ncbi:hypothetical protein ASL14_18935 [Paenibacillus sp. IHB B 3084]|uniref:hypothetical protein n=1 Tax=Paenibacillus sp. IHB B 3084 TaxID=867076 RepID=UPI000722D8A9|nr:hypothetical protein [Paenibacillus sp. IHB B 3084]ALP37949.1 hypothetical protein ASL14_18935 [Paenibacillus sp. IHB B 3084]
MNIEEFLMIFEWYGIAEGEAGVDLEERKLMARLFKQLSEEDQVTVHKEHSECIHDLLTGELK